MVGAEVERDGRSRCPKVPCTVNGQASNTLGLVTNTLPPANIRETTE